MTRLALLLVAVISQSPAPPTSAQRVECTGTGIAKGREFVLAQPSADRPWRLSYRDASHPAWIHLPLDGARPVLAGGSARVEFSNANGGRQVQLEVGSDTARLDVYVDYGLDVNIDADLDPDVDLMNTEGPLPVECKIVGSDPRDEGARPQGVRPQG